MGARGLRSTKVVGTIGPACDSPEQIRALIGAGLNVARLNFSHGNHEQHAAVVKRIREAERDLGSHIAIMGDTRGPEVRTGVLQDGPVRLDDGEPFTLRTAEGPGDSRSVWVSHLSLPDEVQPHRSIYLDDGSIQLSVSAIRPGEVDCIVMRGGILGDRKGVSVPGSDLSLPALGDSDLADLTFAAQQRFDYVAASFVRTAEHIEHIRSVLREAGADIPVIAKIEHRSAIDNLTEIVAAADGTMVARGDLGVEMPVELSQLCLGECYRPTDVRRRIERIEVIRIRPQVSADEDVASLIDDPWQSFECPDDPSGCVATFVDPEFSEAGRDTVYYARVLEEPSPTVNGGDPMNCDRDSDGRCLKSHMCEQGSDCTRNHAQRAWSSPIYVDYQR